MKRIVLPRSLTGTVNPEPQAYEIQHAALARKAAAEGFVLLKNEADTLPLKPGKPVALYGAGASRTIKGGTGSGDVNERYSVSIYEGLKNAGLSITTEAWIAAYDRCYDQARAAWKQEILEKAAGGPKGLEFFFAYSTTPFLSPVGDAVVPTDTDTAIYVLSRVAGEGADRFAAPGDYFLQPEEHQMLADICAVYPRVILLVNTGGVVDLSFLDEFPQIQALLVISQPGMEGGNAVADVLLGKVNPSGKLTDSWAYRYEDYPNAATFSHNNGNVQKERYEEGIYVGYRYFDSFGIPVRYGFGEGLSYTTFAWKAAAPQVGADGTVTLDVTVANTGSCAGREVVQLYAALPAGRLEKEARRLCAFAKTDLLAPGQSQTLTLSFTPEELASYDEDAAAWLLEPGLYGLWVGTSLKASQVVAALRLAQETVLLRTAHICPCQEELSLLHCTASRAADYSGVPTVAYDLSSLSAQAVDYADPDPMDDEAGKLVATLPTEKLIALATGDPSRAQGSNLGAAGSSVPGSAGETSDCALEEGIANISLADGPAGLRLNPYYYARDGKAMAMPIEASLEHGFFYEEQAQAGEKRYQYCTAIPVGTLLAQSWDLALVEELGSLVGEEMVRFGVTLWLAPGMNIHRNPLCGRNFEYYSEDPLVSGKMAAAITRGVQRHPGCGTTIKHYACNNQEDNRMGSDSILTERTLREIYLRGFGIAIRESKPLSMMTSYNLVNGVHAANNYDLCTKVARREFGFDGFIMTDWTTTEHGPDCTAAGCMRAGNDVVMPGQYSDHESIRAALEDGSLSLETLRGCITRLTRVVWKSNFCKSEA